MIPCLWHLNEDYEYIKSRNIKISCHSHSLILKPKVIAGEMPFPGNYAMHAEKLASAFVAFGDLVIRMHVQMTGFSLSTI